MKKKVLMPIDRVLLEMKVGIRTAKDDKQDMAATDWDYQDGYLLSFNDCQMILDYIKMLKYASGRK